MPHIIVEHTEDTIQDPRAILTDLHETLGKEESVDIGRIKTRAHLVSPCIVGEGDRPDQMIHITLKLMPGRDDETRSRMAKNLHAAIRKHIINLSIPITAEVMEIDKGSYTTD